MVPCFNEEELVEQVAALLSCKLHELAAADAVAADSRVLFVDDGSTDATWSLIRQVAAAMPEVGGIRLAKNCGQQLALYAGMLEAVPHSDVCITLDADGQDDIAAVDAMLAAHAAGSQVVYAVRRNRDVDTPFKRISADAYQWLLDLLGVRTMKGHADYRLASAQAIRMLAALPKRTIFLRGQFPQLAVASSKVEYTCMPRMAGESKYSPARMVALAADGVANSGAALAKLAAGGLALLAPSAALLAAGRKTGRALGLPFALAGAGLLGFAGAACARFCLPQAEPCEIVERV